MKIKNVLFLLTILAIFLLSCNNTDNEENIKSQTDTNSITNSDIKETIESKKAPDSITTADVDAFTKSYRMPISNPVIIEIREFIEIDYLNKSNDPEEEYTAIAINIIKDFDDTFDKKDYKEKRHLRMNFLDDETRDEISEKYDDVILAYTSKIDQIEIGSTVFTEMYSERLKISRSYFVPFYEIMTITVGSKESSSGYEEIFEVIPIIDDKISIPEKIRYNDGNYFGYGNTFMWKVETANKNLIKLGVEDALFFDGMTVDKFEEFLRLATDDDTFLPLKYTQH